MDDWRAAWSTLLVYYVQPLAQQIKNDNRIEQKLRLALYVNGLFLLFLDQHIKNGVSKRCHTFYNYIDIL